MISRFRAGETLDTNLPGGEYSQADGWEGSLHFRPEIGGEGYDVEGAGSGTDYVFTKDAEDTADWIPGIYRWFFQVSKGAARKVAQEGTIEFLPSLAMLQTTDSRSHNKKVLDALNSLIEGKATNDAQSYSIAGRQITKMPIDDLMKWKAKYEEKYRRELANERAYQGKPRNKQIKARF